MFVCICHAVTENEVRSHIRRGARTADEIGLRCHAGTGCGSCLDRVGDLLAEAEPEVVHTVVSI